MTRGVGERGASLLETIASVAILVLLATAAVPGVLRLVELGEEQACRERLDAVGAGLRAFWRDHGRFPTEAEGLAALLTDPGTGSWRGPYLRAPEPGVDPLEDPRGHLFAYTLSGSGARVTPPGFPSLARTVLPGKAAADRVARAGAELALVAAAAERWRQAHGSWPSSATDLEPLLGADLLRDPWGRTYRLDTAHQVPFSVGPDGTAGTADDVHPPGWDSAAVPAAEAPPSGGSGGGVTPADQLDAAIAEELAAWQQELQLYLAAMADPSATWEERYDHYGRSIYHALRWNGLRQRKAMGG